MATTIVERWRADRVGRQAPRIGRLLPGLLLSAALAALAMWLAEWPMLRELGVSALTLAIVSGIVVGNTVFPAIAAQTGAGVDVSKGTLLRAGIVLYGFRITFQQIGAVGWSGIAIDVVMVSLTFLLTVLLGVRVLKLDRTTSMLIGAGSAICGAAAVMATEPVVRGQAHQVSVAVATVVVFGTLGMFAYPLLYPYLGLSAHAYGVYAGSTIHEVAQVVVAGRAIGEDAAASAVIEKMLRVMLLAPFLVLLSLRLGRTDGVPGAGARIVVPWFAVLFVAVSGFHSLALLPASWVAHLLQLDTWLLAMAMAALGLRTQAAAIRRAGAKPLLLALCLFAFLVLGGLAVNGAVTWLATSIG